MNVDLKLTIMTLIIDNISRKEIRKWKLMLAIGTDKY